MDSGSDLYLALLAYRQAPLEAGMSPADLLMGRALRSGIPGILRRIVGKEDELGRREKIKDRQVMNYDRGSKELEELVKGDVVRLFGDGCDKQAVVKSRVNQRSYVVVAEGGGQYRRNKSPTCSCRLIMFV